MSDLLQRLFDISKYHSLIERDRARMVYTITVLLLLLFHMSTIIIS